MRYAESFVVPASFGAYRIRPLEVGQAPLAIVKVYVRDDAAETLDWRRGRPGDLVRSRRPGRLRSAGNDHPRIAGIEIER